MSGDGPDKGAAKKSPADKIADRAAKLAGSVRDAAAKAGEVVTQVEHEAAGEYTADRARVCEVLNTVVASEIVCYLRYTQNAIAASGIDKTQVADRFKKNAADEMDHFLLASNRVNTLGGTPDLDPGTLVARAHTEYVAPEPTDLRRMLQENLVAERIAIESYLEIIRWLGDGDPTSRRMMEEILGDEEDHADELNDLLGN